MAVNHHTQSPGEKNGWSVLPNWVVREKNLSGTEKLIYISLLNRANTRGECWPSLATLADDAGVSRNTVVKQLKSLQKRGLVKKYTRKRGDGSRESNFYRVSVWALPNSDTEGGSAESALPSANEIQGVVQSRYGGSANEIQEVLHIEEDTVEVLPKSEVANATRPEVEYLLNLLEDLIEANGAKRPKRNKANRDAARLMLDRDGRTVEQIEHLIRWSQSNEFWRANILSMSKLREKFDQLKLKSQENPKPSRGGDVPFTPSTASNRPRAPHEYRDPLYAPVKRGENPLANIGLNANDLVGDPNV